VYSSEDHEFVRAWIIDLSQRGIGMQMNRPLELGRHVIIVMRTNDNTRSMEFSARVVRCHPLPQGDWQIGGEFSVPLTPEDLDQFL
jgi:Tfp pilus assembly protein PilZ